MFSRVDKELIALPIGAGDQELERLFSELRQAQAHEQSLFLSVLALVAKRRAAAEQRLLELEAQHLHAQNSMQIARERLARAERLRSLELSYRAALDETRAQLSAMEEALAHRRTAFASLIQEHRVQLESVIQKANERLQGIVRLKQGSDMDLFDLEFRIKDSPPTYRSSEALSAGGQLHLLLSLLLLSNDRRPLVIDDPFVLESAHLGLLLRRFKGQRQVILTSSSADFAFTSDADQVIVLKRPDGGRIFVEQGPLGSVPSWQGPRPWMRHWPQPSE